MDPLFTLTLALVLLVGGSHCVGEGEGKQLIMLEIEKLNYPGDDKVVKRQAQVQYSGTPGQYIVQTSGADQQQVPPEYLSLLQQLSPQQAGRPQDIQQVFISRSPQQFLQPQGLPPRPPLTPEQQEMRRLQEEAANKHIREQQERALNRALQTGRFETGFQPQVYQQQQPLPTPQPQAQAQAYQQQAQYESSFPSEPQYYEQPPSPQYYQQRSIRPAQAPLKYSYSQVSFGSSESAREALEPRLESIQQRLQSQEKPPPQPQYYNPQPQPQPQVTYNVQPQQQPQLTYNVQPQQQPQLTYNVQPQQQSVYNVQPQQQPQQSYNVQPQQQQQSQQQTPTTPQHPQQYLIETTRPAQSQDQVVRIPRPRVTPAPPSQSLYFRPDPAAIPVRSSIANTVYVKPPVPYTTIPQDEGEFLASAYRAREQSPSVPEEDAPSRSAIYVQHSGISKRITTQPPQPPSSYDEQFLRYNLGIPRIPTAHGQRALTNTEMKALLHAGFQISPLTLNSLQESSDITPSSEAEDEEYRTNVNAKRQSQFLDERKPPGKYPKRIPKPVPLTETERKLLADQGIRNLYRVESSESKDAPVTYVLAIDNAVINKRESDSSSSHKTR